MGLCSSEGSARYTGGAAAGKLLVKITLFVRESNEYAHERAFIAFFMEFLSIPDK